jgi:triacylglycerol lipase
VWIEPVIEGRAVQAAPLSYALSRTSLPLFCYKIAVKHPVLLVHGIWDVGARFDRLRSVLEAADIGPIEALDLAPNDGSGRIEELASQLDRAATNLLERAGVLHLDLVGFSMGALVSRYWLQRMGGKERTRRFVSISGPHNGTLTAFAMRKAGVVQMRPKSELIAALDADPDPWGACEVHTLWTPYDLMIVPAKSSRLPKVAHEHVIPVALHRWMITDRRALSEIVTILRER